ncbi:MAG: hypothetical protein R2991_04360 [Thermoanaerobaculia bacterium]
MRSMAFVVVGLAMSVSAGGAVGGAEAKGADGTVAICSLRPFGSVDNGLGAQVGTVREFDSGLIVPQQCLIAGRMWIPRIGFNLTRTAAGPANISLQILGRRPAGTDGPVPPPGQPLIPARTVQAQGISRPPGSRYYEYDAVPPDGSINNILWGLPLHRRCSRRDELPDVFFSADLQGPPGQTLCYTGVGGAVPADPCTNGQPALNAIGIGADVYTSTAAPSPATR